MAFSQADKIRRRIAAQRPSVEVNSFESYCAVIASNKRQLNRKQREYVLAEDRITDFVGPVGCAKTTAALTRFIARATLMPGSQWGVFRSYFWTMMAPGGLWQTFVDCCERLGPHVILSKKGDGPIELDMATTDPETGKPGVPAHWVFQGLDEYNKLGSTMFTGILVCEANEIDEVLAGKLNERLRYKRPPPYEDPNKPPQGPFYLEFEHNPVDEMHWLHKRFCSGSSCAHQDNCDSPPWGKQFRADRTENEANLPDGYYETISAGYTAEQKRRYVDGQCGADPSGEGVFKDSFIESLHVGDLKFDIRVPKMIRGWDFGRRRPACVWRQITPEGWHNNLRSELGENESTEKFATRVQLISAVEFPLVKEWLDFVDPHGNAKRDVSDETSIDVMFRLGFSPKWRDVNIARGIEIMEENLTQVTKGRPRKMFDRKGCRYLIAGYGGGYKYPDRQIGDPVKPEPKKDGYYEHGMDADRYIDVNLKLGSTVSLNSFKPNLRRTTPPKMR